MSSNEQLDAVVKLSDKVRSIGIVITDEAKLVRGFRDSDEPPEGGYYAER